MKFIIRKVSDYEYQEVKEFDSLEGLVAFYRETGRALIMSNNSGYGNKDEVLITIFDDYLDGMYR